VITSYNPQTQDITKEETGANTETDKQVIFATYTALLKAIDAKPGNNSRTKANTH
jgi:type I restriction enzyme, R subunit